MFSKACEYAIRAMIYIAQKGNAGHKVGVKEVAEGIDSPEHFVAKILQQLSRKNLVQSLKGPNGGFFMEADALQTSLADIVLAVDGDGLFTQCGLGLKYCSEKNPCPIHEQYKAIRCLTKDMLERTKVSEFNELLNKGVLHLRK
ncbi:RrF2 family transcriptional regulator [Chitinophaga nivalis]|uniref:Rrf2 family transcriptional regulator n=1 Tax=Chitinophaga nivalis TaxID=2991709 RepID=A0ABT3IKH0_9BACT|nr:Rrf2 family transcriptional regulator [Chitinophaga nivalis]MCW3465861.1 Rrf2 family transcriptional regulator [Chitinophaga nivalis]MCW3484448.1 Rrf2 family transcriptional regulator [Chitinophaga nivalis]